MLMLGLEGTILFLTDVLNFELNSGWPKSTRIKTTVERGGCVGLADSDGHRGSMGRAVGDVLCCYFCL